MIPTYITAGAEVVVNTERGEYMERAKEDWMTRSLHFKRA